MSRSVMELPATYPVAPAETIWRLSVEQYHEMIRSGIIGDDDPVELLEGCLVQKMGKNPPHSVTTRLLREALARVITGDWFVDTQEPVSTEDSEPEPDVSVVRGSPRLYGSGHPGPHDVALVVEVAESSLGRDKGIKMRIYARSRVPVYWIVNLNTRMIEVYTGPVSGRREPHYRLHRDYAADESVPVVLDGKAVGSIAVRDILP